MRALLMAVCVMSVLASSAVGSSPQAARQVFVQVNQYYVLQMFPAAPFIDRTGHLLVPVPAFAELVGAEASVDQRGGTATVGLLGRTVHLTAGSGVANLDGRQIPIFPIPQRQQGSNTLLVPLRALMAAFGLSGAWRAGAQVFSLQHPRLMDLSTNTALSTFHDFILQTGTDTDTTALVPVTASLRLVRTVPLPPTPGIGRQVLGVFDLHVRFKRIRPIQNARARVAVFFLTTEAKHIQVAGPDLLLSPDQPPDPDPCRWLTDEILDCRVKNIQTNAPADTPNAMSVRYIIARVRLRK